MASPFSNPIAGSFTALLTADEDDDDFTIDQQPFHLLHPLPETLESIIPPSILSGHFSDHIFSIPPPERIPSYLAYQNRSSIHISPRKRSNPMCSSLFDYSPPQPKIPKLHSPDDFPPPILPHAESPPSLDSILSGFSLSGFVEALMSSASPVVDDGAADPVRSRREEKGKEKKAKEYAKDRRKKISEKVRVLGSLLPGDTKPDLASLLEKAHSYIRFLQVQVKALESMPRQSSAYGSASTASSPSSDVAGLLGSLTRQQLLQAVVNSPTAQALLISEKSCIVSAEQVATLKRLLCQSLGAADML